MRQYRVNNQPLLLVLMVMYATVLHGSWAASLLAVRHLIPFTNASTLDAIIPSYQVCAGVLFVASGLAVYACFGLGYERIGTRLLLLLPQQIILALSAASAISAVALQHYGDGVPRSWTFILLDQMPSIVGAALHTVAVVAPAIAQTSWRG